MSDIKKELKTQKQDLVSSFNNICLNMANYIASKFPKSQIGMHISLIRTFIDCKPSEVIARFIQRLYSVDIYIQSIKNKDENFFLNHTYDELKGHKWSDDNMFEFKDLWFRLEDESKELIKESMLLLVEHTEKYITILAELNKLKKKD